MKMIKVAANLLSSISGLWLVLLLLHPPECAASLEQTFDVLQIGTTTYRNVTVTTKSRNYIFILHSRGMTNLKVSDLPTDLRAKLGYDLPPAAKTNTPAVWARQTLAKMEVPQVKQLEAGVQGWYHRGLEATGVRSHLPALGLDRNMWLMLGGGLLLLYLLHSYCCLMICLKAGTKPGALIWVPVLQILPLVKAAGMSAWWFLGFLIPGVNLIAQVLWCINITRVRGKTFLVALLLIFPLSSPLAVLYLAFSGGRPRPKPERRVEIMTLETA